MTGGVLDVFAKVMGLLSPFILALLAWIFKKRIDDAQAKATEASARATDASAEKTRVETSGLAVTNAVTAAERIVALYQAQQEREARLAAEERGRKDEETVRFRAEAEAKIGSLQKQVDDLASTQRQFAVALLPHALWDGKVWRDAREHIDRDYEAPPPFGIDGVGRVGGRIPAAPSLGKTTPPDLLPDDGQPAG